MKRLLSQSDHHYTNLLPQHQQRKCKKKYCKNLESFLFWRKCTSKSNSSHVFLWEAVKKLFFLGIIPKPVDITNQRPARFSFLENSREFFFIFTSRFRSRAVSISLSLLEKVKGFHFSLFISRQKLSEFHSFFSRKKSEIRIAFTFFEKWKVKNKIPSLFFEKWKWNWNGLRSRTRSENEKKFSRILEKQESRWSLGRVTIKEEQKQSKVAAIAFWCCEFFSYLINEFRKWSKRLNAF